MTDFDREVKKAFKTDNFILKRLEGLLDFKKAWNRWRGYENYGIPKNNSKEAIATGGRPEEPMCMHFFMGKTQFPGKVLLRYKFKETDSWDMPYNHEGIPVFSEYALSQPSLFNSPDILEPEAWDDKEAISNYLLKQADFTPEERQQLHQFFDNVPTTIEDIPDNKRFRFLIPDLAKKFKEKQAVYVPEGYGVGESVRPEKPDERVTWSLYTKADYRKDVKQRAVNYSKEKHALGERNRSEHLSHAVSSNDTDKLQQDHGNTSSSDDSAEKVSSSSAKYTNRKHQQIQSHPLGNQGIVSIGDVLLVYPDEDSQKVDCSNGYTLGLCLGRVTVIDLKGKQVNVWWFFGDSWSAKAKWIEWIDKSTKHRYTDWVPFNNLLVTSYGTLAKITQIKKSREQYLIDRKSLSTIEDVQQTNDD